MSFYVTNYFTQFFGLKNQIPFPTFLETDRSIRSFGKLAFDSINRAYNNPHKRTLLKELGIEIIRISGLGLLASSFFVQKTDEGSSSGGASQMATAIMIAPLFSNVISKSLSNIGRKMSLLFAPVLVAPGIKKSAEYRSQFEETKELYTKSMQEFVEQILHRYTFILEHFNFDNKEMANAIEEVLRLPLRPKLLEKKKPKIIEILENYPDAVRDQMAQFIAEINSHSRILDPIKRITPVMLVGPPGTGKTFIVKQMSQALGLPICEVKIADYRSITGNSMWSNDPERGVILDALLQSSLQNHEEKPSNVILFIDEPDKVLEKDQMGRFTHPSGNAVNTFLHSILETGSKEFPIERYDNATHSIKHIIVVLGSNRSFSEVLGKEAALALESRIRTVDFSEGFDTKKKRAIVSNFILDFKAEYGADLEIENDEIIEKIIKRDDELKLKGVLILLEVVNQYLQSLNNADEILYYKGSDLQPFDIEKAYAKYISQKEEKCPSYIW